MRALAIVMWVVTAVWLVLAVVGALGFQELYGGSSGLQVFAIISVVGLIPALIGWWAYRRSRTHEDQTP